MACGVERWPVKILADDDRIEVDLDPVPSSIAELASLAVPTVPLATRERLAPHELTTFRIEGLLLEVISEEDSDLHVVVGDPLQPTATMIVEIPHPDCSLGSDHLERFGAARRALADIALGSRVEVIGVGFFDFAHGQTGRAPNGFELHPVLSIRTVGR